MNSATRAARALQRTLATRTQQLNFLPRPQSSFLLPIRTLRAFNTTAPIIEPNQDAASLAPKSPEANTLPKQPSSESKMTSESVRALLPVLAAQPEHYITVHINGSPYLVTPGDHVRLPFRMPGVQPGDILRLNRASVLGSRDLTLKGSPFIDEELFDCRAIVLGVESEPMRLKIKKKRRTRRSKTVKSKHRFTLLSISELKIKVPEA